MLLFEQSKEKQRHYQDSNDNRAYFEKKYVLFVPQRYRNTINNNHNVGTQPASLNHISNSFTTHTVTVYQILN
jgi:hypothetical protein